MMRFGGTTWWPARRRLAGMAILTVTLTGVVAATQGGSAAHVYGAGGYLVLTLIALLWPSAIVAHVIGGQLLAGSVLVAPGGGELVPLLAIVAGAVATAELLAGAARLNMPIERDGREDMRRAVLAAVAGAGVFGAVALVGTLPGPSGLVAVALASGACIVLALLLVRSEPNKRPSDS
jgi:hypothetical protein